MESSWLQTLAPIANTLLSRISSGEKLRSGEQTFILLYSIAHDIKELRADFQNFHNALSSLSELVNELRTEAAFLKGKIMR